MIAPMMPASSGPTVTARRIATGDRMHVHAAFHDDRLEEVALDLLYGHTAAATAGAAGGPSATSARRTAASPATNAPTIGTRRR